MSSERAPLSGGDRSPLAAGPRPPRYEPYPAFEDSVTQLAFNRIDDHLRKIRLYVGIFAGIALGQVALVAVLVVVNVVVSLSAD